MMNHQGGECLHAAHAEGILPLFFIRAASLRVNGAAGENRDNPQFYIRKVK